ncbi:MAG: hypothetical protein IT326_00010 [Anaerolineae bacterium]|nr:hypothetical protein [Anaerolineae bacterium]
MTDDDETRILARDPRGKPSLSAAELMAYVIRGGLFGRRKREDVDTQNDAPTEQQKSEQKDRKGRHPKG